MDAFINAVKSDDLVKAKKAFGPIMLERTAALMEARKKELAAKIMIEGEDDLSKEKDEDEEAAAKKNAKDSEVEDSKKNNGKEIDSKKPNEEERTA